MRTSLGGRRDAVVHAVYGLDELTLAIHHTRAQQHRMTSMNYGDDAMKVRAASPFFRSMRLRLAGRHGVSGLLGYLRQSLGGPEVGKSPRASLLGCGPERHIT